MLNSREVHNNQFDMHLDLIQEYFGIQKESIQEDFNNRGKF